MRTAVAAALVATLALAGCLSPAHACGPERLSRWVQPGAFEQFAAAVLGDGEHAEYRAPSSGVPLGHDGAGAVWGDVRVHEMTWSGEGELWVRFHDPEVARLEVRVPDGGGEAVAGLVARHWANVTQADAALLGDVVAELVQGAPALGAARVSAALPGPYPLAALFDAGGGVPHEVDGMGPMVLAWTGDWSWWLGAPTHAIVFAEPPVAEIVASSAGVVSVRHWDDSFADDEALVRWTSERFAAWGVQPPPQDVQRDRSNQPQCRLA